MSKLFKLLTLCAIPLFASAQINSNAGSASIISIPLNQNRSGSGSATTNALSFTQTVIGNTLFDLQSNEGSSRRIVNNGNGTISAVWTISTDPAQSTYSDRGTGYNYFNGTSWGSSPTARIESSRTGFTNIGVVGGKEYVLAHLATNVGVLSSRTLGSGSWSSTSPVGGTSPGNDNWFRLAVGGSNGNSIHAIVNSQGTLSTSVLGQSGPITYSRSTNGGSTWDIQHIVLPGSNATFYTGFGAENYSIDCSGDTVVVVAGLPLHDVVMWKSVNNGTSWTKTIIQAAPVAAYNTSTNYTSLKTDINGDGVGDTVTTCSGDINVTLDINGKAWVTWSNLTVCDNDVSTVNYYIKENSYGISYWKEGMSSPAVIDGIVDQNNDGRFTVITNATYDPFSLIYKKKGLTCHPQIGMDPQNNIFLVYSAVCETSDTITYQAQYRHIYLTYSTDSGATWSIPEDLTVTNNREGLWPSIAKLNTSSISIVYQRDDVPDIYLGDGSGGSALCTFNAGNVNDIVYVGVQNPALSSIVVLSGPTTVCRNGTATYSLSNTTGATGYTWTVPSGAVILSGQNTSSITVQFGSTSGNVQAVTTFSGGVSVGKTLNVTVQSVSLSTTITNNNYCSGGSATLNASGASTYVWSPSTNLSATTGSSVTANPTSSTTYTVTATSSSGCTTSTTIAVTVRTNPSVSINASSLNICSGSSTTLTANGASTYVWSPSTGLSATTGSVVTATPTSTSVYSVTGTASNGCTATSSVTLTILSRPTVAGTAANGTICSGSNTTLSATGANTYAWSPSTGLNATTGTPVTASPTVTTTYTVTGTAANGCTATNTVSVIVNARPNVSASANNSSICSGSSATLTANGGVSYAWSPSTGLNATTGSTVIANPSISTIYTVTGTAANGCTSTATVSITVFAPTNVNVNSSDPFVCPGNSATLTATGAQTYAWSPSTGLSATNGATVIATPSTSTTYTVIGTSSNGCTDTNTILISVSSISANATSDFSTICQGDTTTLHASGGLTYLWSPTNDLSDSTSANVFAFPQATTTYTVLATAADGCTATSSVTISISTALNVIVTTPNQNICAGTTATLTATGATSFDWTPATDLSSTTGSTVIASPSSSTTYTVIGTSITGCTGSATIQVTPVTNPTVNVNATNGTICSGSSTTLTANGATTYSWSGSSLSSLTGTSVTASPTGTTTYTVIGTDGNGCTNSDVITVNVNQRPTVQATPVSGTICLGSNTSVNATGASTYAWSPSTGLSSSTGSTVQAGPTSNTTYTVIGTDANTCTGSTTFSISVAPVPSISANATNATICSGNSSTLSATGGVSYSWTPSTGLSATTGSPVIATPTSTTTYTVIGTSANGCTASSTVSITVNTLPTVNVTAGNNSICSGTSTTLSANGASTYSWSPSTGLSSTTGASVTAGPSSTTTYTVTGTASNGCTATNTKSITVLTTPSVSVSASSQAICSGVASTLTANGASTYAWSPSTGLSATTGSTVTATPTSGITYTVVGTAANSCTASATVSIAVSTNPTVSVSATSTSVCSGNSSVLTGNGATTYSWSPSAGLNATTGSSVTATPTSTSTYTVTGTNAAGCTATNTITINVNSRPTISTAGNSNVCNGSTTSLTANGANTYTWSPSSGLNTTIGAAVTATVTGNINYTVTGTAANGCTATSTISVVALANPIVSASASSPAVCSGTPTTLTANGANTYVWSPVTGLSSASGSSVTATPSVAVTYTVTGTAANGCTATATIGVTVSTIPTVVASITEDTLCSGQQTQLSATGASTYTWSPSSGLNSTSGTPVIATPLTSTTYTVIGTSAAGCTSSSTIAVLVNPSPSLTVTAGSNALCPGSSTSITANGATTYSWSPATGLNTTSGSVVNANPSSTITYTVTGTEPSGCSSTNTVTIAVSGSPAVVANAGIPAVCPGNSTTLTANGANTYQWSPSTGLSATIGTTVTATPGSTTTYTVTGTATGGCTATNTVTVVVYANPSINIVSTSQGVCPGESATLTANGASSYAWSPSGQLSAATGTSVIATPTASTTYTVVGTSANGCTATQTISLTLYSLPNVNVSASSNAICPGASTTLSANGAVSYLWSPSGGLSATTGSSVIASPTANATYTVIGTSVDGCTNSASVSLTIIPVALSVDNNFFCINTGDAVTINATGASTYVWSPSNGLSSTTDSSVIANPLNSTTYTVQGTNSLGCTASLTVSINVGNFPFTVVQTGNPTPCQGDEAYLIVQSTSPFANFQWYKNGNVLSGENNDSLPITGSGNYQIQITIGPCDTLSSIIPITVFPAATIPVISTATTGCTLQGDTLYSSGSYSAYLWSNGDVNAATPINTGGIYTVTVTDANGCTATSLPFDYTLPFVSAAQVCLVTVDSTIGKNLVVWEKPSLYGIDSFYVYREDISTAVYDKIGAVSANATAVFQDQTADPILSAQRYKISVLDTCGNETDLSSPQRTIRVLSVLSPGGVDLSWNNYEGNALSQYYILRATAAGNFTVIDSVPFGQLNYTDSNPPVGLVYYAIEVYTNICSPDLSADYLSSRSNETSILFVDVKSVDSPFADIIIAPNPVHDVANLIFNVHHSAATRVSVHDITGKVNEVIYQSNLSTGMHQLELNVEKYQPGVYFISIESGEQVIVKKIVVL